MGKTSCCRITNDPSQYFFSHVRVFTWVKPPAVELQIITVNTFSVMSGW